jgi:hypothetical protein
MHIVTRKVTVDGILDWQSDLLYTSTNYYNRVSQFFNQQLCRLHSRSIHLSLSAPFSITLCLHSRYPSAATWFLVYSLGPDPIGNTALVLLSGRYQVTPSKQTAGGTIAPLLTHQAHSMHVTIFKLLCCNWTSTVRYNRVPIRLIKSDFIWSRVNISPIALCIYIIAPPALTVQASAFDLQDV